ncbi:MAG: prephenate dehydrogenase/arogenate dehydrogenase family protein, partial [Akkermansiaceae bacterium]|nr:prephenate dehydrogenase/arogenate dehydrogenase family protein [Armatimonadota bacterium]
MNESAESPPAPNSGGAGGDAGESPSRVERDDFSVSSPAPPELGAGAASGFLIPRLCIVGVGLIGGSIGLAAKTRNAAGHVVGVEANADTWADALRIGAVDEITNDLAAGVRGADLVILAVPVGAILELLPKLPPLIGENTVVTDVGSVKTAIAEAGFAALGGRFIPGHPMAGSEKGGVQNARADLFDGATWAFTSVQGQTDRGYPSLLLNFVQTLGASAHFLSPTNHDESVALTSHLPHILAYTLGAMAFRHRTRDRQPVTKLAAGSWNSATRVAESSPMLWLDISWHNHEALADEIDECAEKLMWIADRLRK